MRAESSGIDRPEETAPRHDISPAAFGQPSGTRPARRGAGRPSTPPAAPERPEPGSAPTVEPAAKTKSRQPTKAAKQKAAAAPAKVDEKDEATELLQRALRLGHDKADADEWLHSSAVKTHMRRMDPSFSEKALGYRSFSDFLKSRGDIAELEETGHERLVRLREP